MTPTERQKMIDKLNKKKPKNPKMVDTFFQINGREPMDEEMITGLDSSILQDNLFNSSLGGESNQSVDNDDENENDDTDLLPLPTLNTGDFTVDTDDEIEEEDSSDNITMEVDDMENENFINTSSV